MMLLLLAGVFLLCAGLAAVLAGASPETATRHGGLALYGAFSTAVLILVPLEWLDLEPAVAFTGAGALLVGFDYIAFSPRIQRAVSLGVSLAAVLWGLVWIWLAPDYARIPPLPFAGTGEEWGAAGFAFMAIALAVLAHLGRALGASCGTGVYLAMGIALPAALIAYLTGAYCHAWLLAAFAVSCAGLLVYNRSPALIVAGSGGGAFLALMPGLLAALSAPTIGLEIWAVLLGIYGLAMAAFGNRLKPR